MTQEQIERLRSAIVQLGRAPKPPPLGIMPRYVWIEKRLNDLKAAMQRCLDADSRIMEEWVKEYNQLISEVEG